MTRETVDRIRSQVRPGFLKALLWISVGLATATGFRVSTPRDTDRLQDSAIAAIAVKDSLRSAAISARVDTLVAVAAELRQGVSLMWRLECVAPRYSRRDHQLAGLDCEHVLRGDGVRQAGRGR